MTNSEYIQAALRTESTIHPTIPFDLYRVLHAGMGLSTEAGEILDSVKKIIFYGKTPDWHNLIEEAGDIFWYLAILCDAMNVSFEEVQRRNIDKLKVRYPDKFTQHEALNRNLDEERKTLEGTK